MKYLIYLISSLPFFVHGQEVEGIRFERARNWQEILEKAKHERKYIFVDCYATWCGPCKKMEQEVFKSPVVGDVMNAKFISVRLQIDSTSNDNDDIKNWYADAHHFNVKYKITNLPSYLFFSPEGTIVHRGGNYVSITDFLEISRKALDPSTQFYTLLNQYKQGKKDYSVMPYLARTVESLGDSNIADSIALDYKENYLYKVDDSILYSIDILDFVTRDFFHIFYTEGSKGRFFRFFIDHGDTLGRIKGYPDFSTYLVRAIIKKEELLDKLYKGDSIIQRKPDWQLLINNIIQKYGDLYPIEQVLEAQMEFYFKIKNWKQYTQILDKQIKSSFQHLGRTTRFLHVDADPIHISDAWALNAAAWALFLRCNDRKALMRALTWSELSIRLEQPDPNVQYLDTKANLLYKLGRVKDAIELENAAIEVDNKNAIQNGKIRGVFHDEFSSTIAKMKMGQPTWPDKKKDQTK